MWIHCPALILVAVCGPLGPLDEDTLFGYAVADDLRRYLSGSLGLFHFQEVIVQLFNI